MNICDFIVLLDINARLIICGDLIECLNRWSTVIVNNSIKTGFN